MGEATVVLKRGREKSVLRRHPWIFSGAIARLEGEPTTGATVQVQTADGRWLGAGAWSPQSQIRCRLWTTDSRALVDANFIRQRVQAAVRRRTRLPQRTETNACRLVHGESDGLPGLIVDRYGDMLVLQVLAAGIAFWQREIVAALQESCPGFSVYERSDADVRAKEGLPPVAGLLAGVEPPERVDIYEGSVRYGIDIRQGHKTGFYLDQRDNRRTLARYTPGARVLNAFSYTGGFGLWARQGGATQVVNVDVSTDALEQSRANHALNGWDDDRSLHVAADVFQYLRRARQQGERFDVIVLDPPKFIESRAHFDRGCRGYKDINLQALHLLQPGGFLLTFSCSGLLEPALFQKIVADAALDAGRVGRIVETLTAGADHPVELAFPEGAYLKGLVVQVD